MVVKESDKINTQLERYSPLMIPRLMRAHYRAKPKEPLHLSGEPSTVKSAFAYQESQEIAKDEQREFFDWNRESLERKQWALANPEKVYIFADVRASETDIGELRLQDIKSSDEYITFKYNLLFKVLSNAQAKGTLFLDEMNLAPNMIKAQFYKLVNDRCIGDIPLSEGVLVMSAGNEAEHARGVTEDPIPLVLRRANYFIRPLSAEEYVDWANTVGHHQFVTGYLGFQPGDIHKIEYDVQEGSGQPCARTWTKLSNILTNNREIEKDEEMVRMVANGLVGKGVATKFHAYIKAAKKVDLDSIIKNPKLISAYEDDESNISLVYAIIAGVVDKFRTDKKVLKPAFEMSLHIRRTELGAYMLRALKNADEKAFFKAGGSDKIVDDDTAKAVVQRYAKFMFDKQIHNC